MQMISGRGIHNATVKSLNLQVTEKMKSDTFFQIDGNGEVCFLEKQEARSWNTAGVFFLIFLWMRM